MTERLDVVVLGLTLSSSWGNGHAVTYRALLKALAERGHSILFLERDVPWYASHRDLERPDFCELRFYDSLDALTQFTPRIASADAVILGSYTPEGAEIGRWLARTANGVLAFYDIDTPVTLAQLAEGRCAYLARRQIRHFQLYFSFTGGPTLAKLERDYGSPAARALYCSADPALYRPVEAERKWDLSYLGTYSEDRQPTLERLLIEPARLLPHKRFVVAGPQYPNITWPENVERIDHVDPSEHARFYAQSRFTLNVTRRDMVAAGWSPSIRLFEAASCGTAIVSDEWDGLGDLFEIGKEITVVRTAEDVVAALKKSESDVRAMGRAGRARVLAAHTPHHRAEALEGELRAAMARQSRPRRSVRRMPMESVASRKRFLVAGGAGFLGSHLCDRLLASGASVVCIDNLMTGTLDNLKQVMMSPRFEFIRHDILDELPARVAGRDFDGIYDLACAASPPQYQIDPEHTLLTNVIGVRHLLQLAERSGARFLLTSTSEIYGDPEVHPQSESYRGSVNPIGPRACYDEGKRCAETLSFDFARAGRADVRVARIFNTYGPRLSALDGRVVSNVVKQALAGEPITIYGDGSQTRSFCYVDDMIGGLIALMEYEGPQPGPINLGNPRELSVCQLVDLVLELTGSTSPVVFKPLPVDDPRRRRPDISKALEVLGWKPSTPLKKGLRNTIAWFSEHEVEGLPRTPMIA